ncbi:hypothetical protein BT63DRAFT_83809 [Microthyrium microscopicum]|uniref:Uncharacterized protein n=1 Tax=Microthyrium microscopicum TaxID=703497 RepID=A0A6A6U272_9PEZI|nr:hypothetical protein BT63DRAFT_83809 [Microthyrium microscopicum]
MEKNTEESLQTGKGSRIKPLRREDSLPTKSQTEGAASGSSTDLRNARGPRQDLTSTIETSSPSDQSLSEFLKSKYKEFCANHDKRETQRAKEYAEYRQARLTKMNTNPHQTATESPPNYDDLYPR